MHLDIVFNLFGMVLNLFEYGPSFFGLNIYCP